MANPYPGNPYGGGMAPQQQAYGVAPAPYGGAMAAPAGGTVMGVPLQPGERVVYFHKPNYTSDKVALWILFVLTFWILIGFIFLYQVLTLDKKKPRAHIVTTMRVIEIPGQGEPRSHWLQSISDLEPVRQRAGGGGGGLLGAAIRAGVSAVANHMADKKAKTERAYWARAIAVVLVEHGGMRHQLDTRQAADLGVFIAHGFVAGGFHQAPDVQFEF